MIGIVLGGQDGGGGEKHVPPCSRHVRVPASFFGFFPFFLFFLSFLFPLPFFPFMLFLTFFAFLAFLFFISLSPFSFSCTAFLPFTVICIILLCNLKFIQQ